MKPLSLNVLALACAVLFCSGLGRAAVDLQTLVDRSPFTPPGQGPDQAGAAEPQGTLEFRGMVTDESGTAYSIFDTSTNKGRWVRADDSNASVQVKNFDAASNTLEIEQNGKPVKLPLKRATIQAGQAVTAMVPNVPAPGATPGAPGAEARKPDAAADARRLEAVAAEVRRRRALRNASGNRQGQPAPAATPAAPAQTPPAPPAP